MTALLTGLLREDVGALRTRGRLLTGSDGGAWLARGALRLPVRPADPERGDQLGDLVARAPYLDHRGPRRHRRARRLHAVINLLAAELLTQVPDVPAESVTQVPGDVLPAELVTGPAPIRGAEPVSRPVDGAGLAALRVEATAALATTVLRRRARPTVLGRLRPALLGPDLLGWRGAVVLETLAAHRDHPFYPLSPARVGLRPELLPAVAPEHGPLLRLRWLRLPEDALECAGRLPDWWPRDEAPLLPVHPAVEEAELHAALAAAGISNAVLTDAVLTDAVLTDAVFGDAGQSGADVLGSNGEWPARPTLALRTVVPERDPATHLKLPVPMRTLGRLNLRTMRRAGLADGALVSGLLPELVEGLGREVPELAGAVLVADESTWLTAGHPLLAVLLRRWDAAAVAGAVVLPIAGLAAPGASGRPVLVDLAERFAGGDVDGLLHRYLRSSVELHVGLWLRHGVVLEAHPQNMLLAVDAPPEAGTPPEADVETGAGVETGPAGGAVRVRLLVRDLDSGKLDLDLLTESLGDRAPGTADLADARLAAGDPVELLELFVTTTLHQCLAAVVVDVAASTGHPVRWWFAELRAMLARAAARYPDSRHAGRLDAGVLEAARLPVKRTLTAATLLPKSRTGAADVNKYYGADAPTYL